MIGGKIMGITINGRHYSGNNICIVNGRIVSGSDALGEPKKYDEEKSVNTNGIDRIAVKCDCADVFINVTNTDCVKARFVGEVTTDGELKFYVAKIGNEIKVTAELNGSTMNNNLNLFVDIPTRILKKLSVKSLNGDITIHEDVTARRLKIKSTNGNVVSYASFEEITATTMNGNVTVYVNAKNDVEMEVSSMNGNASVKLQNIARCNLSTSSMNGSVKNRFQPAIGYVANGEVSSMNGNVKVR